MRRLTKRDVLFNVVENSIRGLGYAFIMLMLLDAVFNLSGMMGK